MTSASKSHMELSMMQYPSYRKQVLRLTIILGFMGTILCSVLTSSGSQNVAQDRVIEADRIVLRDKAGRERIVLGTDADQPFILFLDADRKPRLSLSMLPDESTGLHMYDKSRRIRAELASIPSSGSQLKLFDSGLRLNATVAAISNGVSGFGLYDEKGETLLGLISSPDQSRQLRIADKKGQCRAGMGVDSKGQPSLAFFDASGNAQAFSPDRQ